MTDRIKTQPHRSLTTETLAAVAAIRGLPVDDALLEELQPMVADMFVLVDGIERWLEKQPGSVPVILTSGGRKA